MSDPAAVFKAYDVRGVVPEQLDAELARRIGAWFATDAGAEGGVAVGHDMRESSPGLASAFAAGVRSTGVDVVAVGLCSTDELYFASGRLGLAGAMFTASHNPARYNGIKLCHRGAVAVSEATGLGSIRERLLSGAVPAVAPRQGRLAERDVLPAYAAHLHTLVPVAGRRLRVVVDAANGMAGLTVPAVFAALDVDLVPLFFDLDGTFPNHEPNPLDPANLGEIQSAVVAERADLGLAFDGDADRCFAVDESGRAVSPSALAALIAARVLRHEPGARIVHSLVTSRALPEIVERLGGVPVRTRVGHSLIKATMAETNAAFGGEHSGHFYFRDFWYADSGMLAALHLLAEVAASEQSVSRLLEGFDPYSASGEINLPVDDAGPALDRLRAAYAGSHVNSLDGVTVSDTDWWFNVRASNTEPLLRLNVEGADAETMMSVRDAVLNLVRSKP